MGTGRPTREGVLRAVVVLAVVGASALAVASGRGPDVAAAPAGSAPACRALLPTLPATLGSENRRERVELAVPGAVAWRGGGLSVVLRCGVLPPGPSPQRCVTVGGTGGREVDWLLDRQNERAARLVTYGRTPAVEVTVDGAGAGPAVGDVLAELVPALDALPRDRRCRGPEDVATG